MVPEAQHGPAAGYRSDTEERGALTQHAQQLNLLVGCRSLGPLEKNTPSELWGSVLEGCACGQHVHAHATLSKTLWGHRPNAQVRASTVATGARTS